MKQEIVARYIGQPSSIPQPVRALIERRWNGRPIRLYALADLDATLTLVESWLALGEHDVALATRNTNGVWDVQSVARPDIGRVQESPGLSANTLILLPHGSETPLFVVRYTQRQRGAFEGIRFVLQEALEGRSVASANADEVYADAVARPVRDAQALVSGRESAVILRLLGYLKPYRKQLFFWLARRFGHHACQSHPAVSGGLPD